MKRSKSFDPTEHAAEWRRLVERAKELLDSGKEPLDAIQWQESADALFAESDLGCLLIGTAMLTDVLEEKIRKKLLNLTGNTIPGRHLDFLLDSKNGPIGTFGVRIIMSHALGIIDGRLHSALF